MVDINKKSLSVWDENAEFWDNEMGDDSNFFHCDMVRPKTDELLDINRSDYVLDIACGNGNYSKWIADKGVKVVAIDFSSKMIEFAKKRRANILGLVDFSVCDATDFSALINLKGDKPFTKAVANMAIMDISEIEPLFKAVYEMLSIDGVFVFSTHHPCFTFPNGDYFSIHAYKGIAIKQQPELQYYFHRPMEYIFNMAFKCGFNVSGFYEIPFEGENEPIIMIVRLSK